MRSGVTLEAPCGTLPSRGLLGRHSLFMLCTERGVACGHGARGGQGGWDLTPEEKGHL